MIKKLLAIGALALAFPAQAAVTINYQAGPSALPAGLTIFEDFESFSNGQALSGTSVNSFAYTATNPGIAAMPAFNSGSTFGAVRGDPTGMYSVAFGAGVGIFSFVLGSLDTYNELTLTFSGGGPDLVLLGAGITQGVLANGSQVDPNTNGRVTYTIDGTAGLITGAKFRSLEKNSFEFDNFATGAVPEPSTWFMMLMGFAAVGFSMRRKQNLRVSFA